MQQGGEVWFWGRNTHGQLGINKTQDSFNIPQHVSSVSRVKTISCGRDHTGLVTANGELYTFGFGNYGKLGLGDSTNKFKPTKVDYLEKLSIKSVACGNEHTMALTDNGDVYTWGYGLNGRLGQGNDFLNKFCSVPVMVGRLVGNPIDSIGCCGAASFALKKITPNTLYVWGDNSQGQLGVIPEGTKETFMPKPTRVKFYDGAKEISVVVKQAVMGESHMACITDKGKLFLWGRNDDTRLGLNSTKPIIPTPQPHTHLSNETITFIAAGGRSTAAITVNNNLYVWQSSESDGNPTATNPIKATLITDSDGKPLLVRDVAVGGTCGGHTTCTTLKGQIWSWGKNNFGQTARPALAHRKNADRMVPMPIPHIQGANQLFCGGYHSAAIITTPQNLFYQYVREGNLEKIKAQLIKQHAMVLDYAVEDITGLYLACSLGLEQVVKLLVSYGASVLISDKNGKCPLHVCAGKYNSENEAENEKYLKCLEHLCTSSKVDLNLSDSDGNTPFHIATQCGNTPAGTVLVKAGASLDVTNGDGMNPLQYCDHSLSFLYKGYANKNDVFIVYSPDNRDLVKDLGKGLEGHFLTSTFTTSDSNVERLISSCTVVLFIVSTDSVKDPSSLLQLFEADKQSKPIFSIWKDKIKIPPNVENIVFTRQLVDFSDSSKFKESLAQLCVGLRKIVFSSSKEDDEEDEIETAVAHDPRTDTDTEDLTGPYVFLSYDTSDKSTAEKFKAYFTTHKVNCAMSRKYDNHPDAKELLSKKIVSCGVFVVLVSNKSTKEPIVRAEVALAENHKRPMIPVFISRNLQLDPSLSYTTANLPKFYVTEESLGELTQVIQIHQRIASHHDILAIPSS